VSRASADKMSEKNFNDCVKEFRQYGYDPYNSADDAQHWLVYVDNQNAEARLARSVPA
jgi:hypothetical protein